MNPLSPTKRYLLTSTKVAFEERFRYNAKVFLPIREAEQSTVRVWWVFVSQICIQIIFIYQDQLQKW